MIVVGGTYFEQCFEPTWDNIFGSGLRAVNLLLECNPKEEILFHTCCDEEIKKHLLYYEKLNPNLKLHLTDVFKSPLFYYDHPLRTPNIFPRLDLYSKTNITIKAQGKNILAFGLLEASVQVDGDKVVYDPQSPINPKSFLSTGSLAKELITVINYSEAKIISGCTEIDDIKDFFFNKEKCFALIIKMGAKGALVFESEKDSPTKIPVFKTKQVWPIGSGDIFSAYFAHSWFNGETVVNSCIKASKATAIYCNSKDIAISDKIDSTEFIELIISKTPSEQIYLAGPFFTFTERWLVTEVWQALKSSGLKVFSPFHDVGHGKAKDVVSKDLKGLDESTVIFAIVDGLDSGTLFEIGYAISQNKKVIAFTQNEDEESLKMLEGTGCIIESDLTTAIYKTYWTLATN